MSDRRQSQPARFDVQTAGLDWQRYPALAAACDKAGCTDREATAARIAAQGGSYGEICGTLRLPYRTARRIARAAAQKLAQHLNVNERVYRYWRQVFECQRNRKEPGADRRGNAGLLPDAYHPNYASPAEWRSACADSQNYREIPGGAVPLCAGDMRIPAVEFLQVICDYLTGREVGPQAEA